MKVFKWLGEHILLVITLFFLAFIPLYPKFPLLDLQHTWVYVRIEDFLVAAALVIWFIQFLRKKATLKTPLTVPILLFWSAGIISTVFAILFIFPQLVGMFPNIAILHALRRIEYLSVFFIAFSAIRDKTQIKYVITVLAITLFAVCIYGYGQRGFIVGWENRFPAFSTMNEEFAKGIPLLISATNRIQSTFAGHYDLAAYLVLMIPIMGSLVFGAKKILYKILFFALSIMGLILLLMTASRVSFAVYLMTITLMLILQKQKKFIIPVVIGSFLLMNSFQGLSQRFASTISQVDVVVDARTGKPVGVATVGENNQIVIEEKQSTGEDLPEGSGYINFPSDHKEDTKASEVVYVRRKIEAGKESTEVTNVEGSFVIKKALAYDVSFTTRFQGEWPRALEAFKRNILLGSGYSSISLATDNNYLRIIGEVGLLGLGSFLLIFLIMSIYVYRTLPHVTSPLTKRFVVGVMAGILGLGLNAILIDVFEASKVAFVLWLLVGVTLGLLHQYRKDTIDYIKELKNVFSSVPAIMIYLFAAAISIFSVMLNNYFVADDFTWLRWVADCKKVILEGGSAQCQPALQTFTNFFTNAQNFFYRPGTKLYFYFLYAFAWLNPFMYHAASLLFHVAVTGVVFLLSNKILKNKFFAVLTAFTFMTLNIHTETIVWISSTGHIISSFFVMSALLLHIQWREKKNLLFFFPTLLCVIIAPLFYELGIVTVPLIIAYDVVSGHIKLRKKIMSQWYYLVYLITIPVYLYLRTIANSHWSGGDYSYNLIKLPYNVFGNLIGYIGLALAGNPFFVLYDPLRAYGRAHIPMMAIVLILIVSVIGYLVYKFRKNMHKRDLTVPAIAFVLFFVPLLPYLGLGNIAPRYAYLSSFGVILFLYYLLHVVYRNVKKWNSYAALIVIAVVTAFFASYNISEFRRLNEDWRRAGVITNNLLRGFNEAFVIQKAYAPNPTFYFIDVPTRYGSAWIFPVGLEDALWFTFQNDKLTIYKGGTVEDAIAASEKKSNSKIFQFNKDGNVEEISRQEITVP